MQQSASNSQPNLAQKIAKWKAGLADLGRRNPLINFKQDSPRSLEILTEEADILFKNLVEGKKPKFEMLDGEDEDISQAQKNKALPAERNPLELITRHRGNEQLTRLKKIRIEAIRSFEERGVNSLFLVLGTLTWYDKDKPKEALFSPLILLPVELIKEPRRDVYKISVLEEDVVLNPTLALKLKQTFGIELPEGEAIQELAYDEIITKIKERLAQQKTWQIKENVFLSLFSYAKAAMVRDIIENEALIFSHPILQAISGDLTKYEAHYREPLPASALDSQVKPERIFQILDADSSQQVVIEAAKSGSSFVVQGPPGTGKSQTIVNMIAELIGDGKSVLLVAEKETALSVVYKRMAECGLNHVCLNLHHSGTTNKRVLIENLSKTIEYLKQIYRPENHHLFFEQLVSSRQSLNSYLTSLHAKEKPLDKSPFQIFGELLKKEREAIPSINVIFSNFSQWNPSRLQEAKDLLNQLSKFLSFFKGEKRTIWAKSSLNSYSYDLELQINERIEEFKQAIYSIQNINQQLQTTLQIQALSNLESLDKCYPALSHILKAPLNLPENWAGVDVSTAQNSFTILRTDVKEIEKNKLSQETQNLLSQLSSFLPFLRGEKTTIWAKSKLQFSSEMLESEIDSKINKFQQAISLIKTATQQIQSILKVQPLLDLADIETLLPALQHILKYPSNLPNNWTQSNISTLEDAFSKLKTDVKFLEENEHILKSKYHLELFSSELPALANRYQKYSRFWFIRIFNPQYRRDIKLLKKLSNKKGQLSHNELKRDLAQAVQIQAARNELYQSNYPARQVFGSLFNSEISSETELRIIEETLSWWIDLQQYSLPDDSVEYILNSPSGRRELVELVKKFESLPEDISRGTDFLFLYFNESDIIGQYRPRNKILFTELEDFLKLAKSNLPDLRKWLTYKKIYGQLENLGIQDFLDALRDNKPNIVESLQNKLRQIDYPARQLFGDLFNSEVSSEAELKEIQQALNWLIDLQKYSMNADCVQRILNFPPKRHELAELVKKYESTHNSIRQRLDFLLSHFDESNITDSYLPRNQIPFIELERFLKLAQSELSYFQEWLTYKETYQKLENLGTTKFLDALRDNQIEPKLWFPVLEKRIYQICLDAILAVKPELKNFNLEVHQRQIKEFSKLDYNQLDAARERLKQLHVQRWQNWEKTSLALAELPKLKKEETKKRQHLPIRKILNDTQKGIPNLVKALKPCWMMSPLSVSQYIDADVIHFDVLIFDEASQLRTEDVVPSIIRSNQVIVIGDRKQLPPTSFFATAEKVSEEDINDEDDASYESVLDECSNFMFGRTLKWHYRSQDERLITFSNKHFYDSKLITFPNPVQNPDLGVYFKHVPDGIYDRGGRTDNQREAEVVALLALEHFQRVPDQSLGIIAFSETQASAIQEQLEIIAKEHANFETFCSDNSPHFFLKALENVQGDERDAIIISIGYARDSQGKLYLNFGPLNKKGGERRLNVAVTRAKSKITLVSSIVHGDIDLTRAESEGVKLLRHYLEYAASGGERLEANSYTDEVKFDSPFEEDVYHTLVEQGYIVRTQVGCSGYRIDLAVVDKNHPGEFLLGIECDGASYHSTPTARDRDRLRQQVLERLGWKIHRIWSTDWFRNKPAQVRLLIERIKQLQLNS
jgi:superfamily I DNA and/or RNA helicase/very-short-patch-repair endonuclease/DNA polymerase III delta prime subunit